MPKGVAYDARIKAAVLAALLTNPNVSEVARLHGVSKASVIMWRNTAGLTAMTAVKPEKRDELGELIAEYVRVNIAALTAQAHQFTNTDWLEKQNAHDVAILHGVLFDKCVDLLTRVTRGTDQAEAVV